MIWLTWRQFRTQAAAVYALLIVLAAVLVITGRPLLGSDALRLTSADSTLYFAGIVVIYLLPAVIGIFWGAPLVTRELEAGTHRLVWNQTLTRSRWLATKLAVTGLAAVAAAGLLSLAVTWWAGPVDAASQPSTIPNGTETADAEYFAARISPLLFGTRGIVPIGYAVFAFVLGVTAGILLRRTVPAMAVTLAVFVAVQIALPFAVRPYMLPATQEIVTITPANISKLGTNGSGGVEELAVAGPPGAWVLADVTVDATGRVVAPPSEAATCVPPLVQPSPEELTTAQECFAKLAQLGYRQQVTYQPADRFWALQWIETAIMIALSALLSWLCFRWARSLSEVSLGRGVAVVTGLIAVAVCALPWVAPAAHAASATSPPTAVPGRSAMPSGTLALPSPTGSHPVGTTSLDLTDTSRPDPWVPTAKARELMVSLWYPATSPGRHRARYMTPKESELLLKDGGITGVPLDVLSKTRTNAFTDAEPAGRKHSLPLVVLSPGYTKPRSELTALAEDLASRGYVVAAIDHTYESVATTFPDGQVATCLTCEMEKTPAWFEKLEKGRAADVSFVLDQLTGSHPKWKGASLINPSQVAMAGHSAGGASTIAAMLKDSRIRAGIDIDGTTEVRIPDSGLSRPFLFLGKPATYTPGQGDAAATWERDWKGLHGWKRWLLVTGAEHESFTDIGVLADQLGIDTGAGLPGARAMEITREYVAAFFDLHLRKESQPLLDKPSTRYPEVKHCQVETKTCQ